MSLVLCGLSLVAAQVWAGQRPLPPAIHPNVSSGDLLEYSDYSDPITQVTVDLPRFMRHDSQQNVVVMFTMRYGDEDKVLKTTKDEIIITKRKDPEANLSQIWHIHKDDEELKQFFSKVLNLDPSDVTIVHIAYSKKESVKKVLVKQSVMGASDILAKLIAAEKSTS